VRRIAVYGLALLLALATLDEGGSAPTGLLAWHGLLVLLLMVELVAPGTERTHELSRRARVALAGYAAVVLVGALLAPYGFAAWLYVLEVAAAIGVAWLAARNGPELPALLARPLLVVVAVQSVLFLFARLVRGEVRPAGTFLNPNHLASWVVAVLLLAWGARFVSGRASRGADLLYAAASVLAVLVVALTGSRGALVGLVAGTAVVFVLAWGGLSRPVRRFFLAGCAVFLVLSVAGVAYRQSQSDPFRYQRWQIWRAAATIAADHPLLGTGPGQFRNVSRRYQFPDGDGPLQFDRGFETTHSDWLRVPAELGAPGLVAILGLLLALIVETARRRARGALTPAAVGAAGALAALLAHALVENLSSRSALVALAAVLTGALVAAPAASALRAKWSARLALCALLGLTLVAGDVAPYLAWRVTHGLSRGHLSDTDAARLDRALRWNPIHPDSWRRGAEHVVGDGTSWDLDGYTRARDMAEHALRLDPEAPEFRLGVARVEAVACRTLFARDEATIGRMSRAYDRTAEADPFQALWPLEEAEAALDCGSPAVAAEAGRRALALEPEAAAPRLVLAAALLRSGSADAPAEAERLLAEAQERASKASSSMPPGPYARRMLTLDARNVERVEHEIREARSADGPR
jgi:O-antigen ligase